MAIAEILTPVFLIIAAGFALGKALHPEVRPLSQLVLYVLTPGLIFSYLSKTQITSGEILVILIFAFCHLLVSLAIVSFTLYLTRVPREDSQTAVLASIFMNTANYGLPVVLFAFGKPGVERAIIYVVSQLFMFNTLGLFLGARAGMNRIGALRQVLKMPSFYAVLLAVLFKLIGLQLPSFLVKTVDMVGQSAIPVMMILLGVQLAHVDGWKQSAGVVAGVTVFRLIVSPVLACLILMAITGLNGITAKVLLVESAMPTAVNNILLAIEFGGNSKLASSLVLVTTVFSFITISFLLWWIT